MEEGFLSATGDGRQPEVVDGSYAEPKRVGSDKCRSHDERRDGAGKPTPLSDVASRGVNNRRNIRVIELVPIMSTGKGLPRQIYDKYENEEE